MPHLLGAAPDPHPEDCLQWLHCRDREFQVTRAPSRQASACTTDTCTSRAKAWLLGLQCSKRGYRMRVPMLGGWQPWVLAGSLEPLCRALALL